MSTNESIKHSAIKYSIFADQWRVEMAIKVDGRAEVSATEILRNEVQPPLVSSKQLSDEQRLQLIEFIKIIPTVPHKSRAPDTVVVFVTEKGSVQWDEMQLLSGAAKEFREWIEASLHPILRVTQLAYQRGQKADAERIYAISALVYQEGLSRLSNWWKPPGLRDDTNVTVLEARKTLKASKHLQARAAFLKVLDERMGIYQSKYPG